MSVFSDVTTVERRAVLSAAQDVRIGRVCMIDESLAAAFGAGVRVDDPNGSAVVDIGGGTTNVAIIAGGKIVRAHAQRIGSRDIDAAITGGGALFGGLDDYLSDQTKLPVRIADEPRYAIVRGLEHLFDEPLWLRHIMREETHAALHLDS